MPKRPDNLETVMLTIELLNRIPRRPRMTTANRLCEDLKAAGYPRSVRSIQRQLQTLANKFDIHCDDRATPYQYGWNVEAAGFSLPRLNEEQSLLLTLAQQHLHRLLPARLTKSMDVFFQQARRNLQGSDSEWIDKVRVVSTTQPLLPPTIDDDVFTEVSNALYANHWLKIEYRNRDGEIQKARVMPLGLAQQGEQLYLVCRFEGYDNERTLALHRFITAKASSLGFERPEAFDLREYDENGRFGYGDGCRVRLTFRISKAAGLHLLEARLSADQETITLEDKYEISATVVDSAQLQWWLQGFGSDVSDVRKEAVADVVELC